MSNETASDRQAETRPRDGGAPSVSATRSHRRHVLKVTVLTLAALVAASTLVIAADPELRQRAIRLLQGGGKTMKVEAPAPAPVDVLGARLDSLAAEIAVLRRTQAAQPPAVDPARLDALSRRLDELARRLDDLNPRIAAAETAAKAPASRPALDAEAIALVALVSALDAGRPFAAHLAGARAALAAMGPQAGERGAALDALASRAETGVPTATMLAARARALRLVAAAPAATATPPTAAQPAPEGLWDRVKARLGSLVTVRRIGEGGGTRPLAASAGADAAVARAAGDFAAGEVAGGVSVLRGVDGGGLDAGSARALAALIADGEARLLADRLAAGPLVARPAPQ